MHLVLVGFVVLVALPAELKSRDEALRNQMRQAATALGALAEELDGVISANGADGVSSIDIARVTEAQSRVVATAREYIQFFEANRKVLLAENPRAEVKLKELRDLIEVGRPSAIAVVKAFNAARANSVLLEAKSNLMSLRTSALAYFQEHDALTADYAALDFNPIGCTDGSRAPVPSRGWIAGCLFIYRIEILGKGRDATFIGHAVGANEKVKGVRWRVMAKGVPEPEPDTGE